MEPSILPSRAFWRRANGKGEPHRLGIFLVADLFPSRRLLKDTTPLQRGIIRHLILIIDLSQSMSEKDLRPTRYLLTLRYAQEFVREFFEQNPISQLGVLGLRDGLALRVSDMSGNPTEHLTAIQALKIQDPKGLPSLQNGLEMARGALLYVRLSSRASLNKTNIWM
jgi:hypothetical protein